MQTPTELESALRASFAAHGQSHVLAHLERLAPSARAAFLEVVVGEDLDDASFGAAQRDGLPGEAEFFGETQRLRATGGKKFGRLDHVATV